MITKIRIQNFKSVEDLTIELGQVNVIIGANGTGKSNILEGIAMGAAAAADNGLFIKPEYLSIRIRTTEHPKMLSGFTLENKEAIKIEYETTHENNHFFIQISPSDDRNWVRELAGGKSLEERQDSALDILKSRDLDFWQALRSTFTKRQIATTSLPDFLIYAPENTFLRTFEEPGQITPLGLRGEGLFFELKQIFTRPEKAEQLAEIKEHLELFEWYEDMELPNGLLSMEYRLSIKDRYRAEGLEALDQRSANEGFLFWLFYLVLFTSEHTPRFFAIDNIETAFNPLLCTEVMIRLTQLAKKHNKQVIFTTHNPAILDGIDLKDDQQRLFIARRGNKGQTLIERLEHKPQRGMKLSELWMKGYIGGIPSNF
jgi:predicted ATPase